MKLSVGKPAEYVSICRIVTTSLPLPVNVGKYFTTGSSSFSLPWSTNTMTDIAVDMTFVTDIMSNSVSIFTASLPPRMSFPTACSPTILPRRQIIAVAPGNRPAFTRASIRAKTLAMPSVLMSTLSGFAATSGPDACVAAEMSVFGPAPPQAGDNITAPSPNKTRRRSTENGT